MTNADKIRHMDDESLEKLLYEYSRDTAATVMNMVSEALVAYMFSKDDYRKTLKDFLKSEDKEK